MSMNMNLEQRQEPRRRQTVRQTQQAEQFQADYFGEWREGINESIRQLTSATQQAAIGQQATTSAIQSLDHRLKLVEDRPTDTRNWLSTSGGCVGQVIYAGIAMLEMLIALAALLVALWPKK